MYDKTDLANLTDKLRQSSEKLFTLPNRKWKHPLKEILPGTKERGFLLTKKISC